MFGKASPVSPVLSPAVSRETLHAEFGAALADSVIEQTQISIKYAGYIDKQHLDVERTASYESLRLPDELDYSLVTALSFEARQKLSKHRPETLGQASRLSGITPAAISLLLVHLKKGRFAGFGDRQGPPPAAAQGQVASVELAAGMGMGADSDTASALAVGSRATPLATQVQDGS